MSDVPKWASGRVNELVKERYSADKVRQAFAAYIAEHEQPPIDPLLLEARGIVAGRERISGGAGYVNAILAGVHDNGISIKLVLSGLRRGIELGKAQA